MTELGPVVWPPAPIKAERLVLRESEARDRAAFIELFGSAEVGTYIGGAQPRHALEHTVPEVPGRRSIDAAQSVQGTSARMPVRPSSATCSCRKLRDAGTPPRRAQRHSTGSATRTPASR